MNNKYKVGDVIKKPGFNGYVYVVAKIVNVVQPRSFPLVEHVTRFLAVVYTAGGDKDYIWLNEDYSINDRREWKKVDI